MCALSVEEFEKFARYGRAAQKAVESVGAIPAFPDPRNRAAVSEYLKTVDDDLFRREFNRRVNAKHIAKAAECPICGMRLPSILDLRKHFPGCKKNHPGSTATLTGVIGEEKVENEWVPVRVFLDGDIAGRVWASHSPETRRSRRVQMAAGIYKLAQGNDARLKRTD